MQANWTWDNVADHLGEDVCMEAEATQKLVTEVFMHELTHCNAAYQQHLRQQQLRELEEQRMMAHFQQSAGVGASSSWPVRAWSAWRGSRVRRETYLTLSFPEHSRLASAANALIMACILWSTAMFCVESVPSVEASSSMAWISVTEYVCLGVFSVEFVGRALTCPELVPFCTSIMNFIDFAAIFPSYVEILLAATGHGGGNTSQTAMLRLLRLLRVLRLLRLGSRFQHMRIVVDALAGSVDVMLMLSFLLAVLLVVAGSVVYFLEEPGDNPGITSIPQAMYFMQTTLTTTGYGEVTPLSWQGRAVCGLLMLTAIITLALPISVISATFTNMWSEYETMRQAAARSGLVWPTKLQLDGLLGTQHQVVLEVGSGLQRCQAALACQVEAAREAGRQARLVYLTSCAAAAKQVKARAGLAVVQGCLRTMRTHMMEAQLLMQQLQALTNALACVRAGELLPQLDRVHLAHKGLRKWFEEGLLMMQEVQLLSDDMHTLRQANVQPPQT